MEITISAILISFVFLFILTWVLKAAGWVWFKPKRLERRLRSLGFYGHPYKFLFGNKKDIGLMTRLSTSEPMDHFSNDYCNRVTPFHYQTIKDYGDSSFYWDGPTPTIIITKPEIVREIMMKMYDFPKPILHPLMNKFTRGLVRLEGQEWAQDRKLINPAFHMNKLKNMVTAFQVSCNDMIDEWEKITSKTGTYELEIWSSVQNMSADAISRAAFGSSFKEGKKVFELLRDHLGIIIKVLQSVYIPGWRFLPTKTNNKSAKITKEIEVLLKGMIYKRQKAIQEGEVAKDDLLGILLKSYYEGIQDKNQDENRNQQNLKISLKQVIEECKLFYIAGQETTSALLVWTLILLSKNKDWQEQAREEVINKFGHNKPNFDGLNDLKKVSMILHEVLRLYPPITSLTRKVSQDVKVGDALLPGGVHINVPMIYIQHDEKLWGGDAKEFKPERFSQGIIKATQGNMSFFSFGWGPRICIGSNFAMIEAKLTLTNILQQFTFELSPSYIHAPTLGFGTLRPQFGAQLIFCRI
ncbi:cytochrome P450 72A397-like [Silene latifolia]|uniref:cytochrome P450 72A397-like n=1 Tax=Silene latifolia TaxID=37657 RepID=UPI003D787A95